MNKLVITGRIGREPELRYTTGGDAILSFSVASDVGYGDKKTTNWFNCQIWGKRGEALQAHLGKGQELTVFGQLTLREWTNKDNVKQVSPDIRVDEVVMHGGKKEQAEKPQQSRRQQASSKPDPNFDDLDDIPFS